MRLPWHSKTWHTCPGMTNMAEISSAHQTTLSHHRNRYRSSPCHLAPNFKAWEKSPFTKGKFTSILGKGEREKTLLKGWCRQNKLSKYHRVGENITTYFGFCLYKSEFDSNFISASCAFPTLSSSQCSQLSQSKLKSTEGELEMSQNIFQRREQHKKSFFAQRAAEERKKIPCMGGRSQKV